MARPFSDHAYTLDGALLGVTGTVSDSGDTTLIAAPGAGQRIVIQNLCLQNESATSSTAILKDGSTAIRRILGDHTGDGIFVAYPTGRERRLSDNSALVLNLSGAYQWGYTVEYWIERSNI